jgi:putative ABC transport system substrate-binding protein
MVLFAGAASHTVAIAQQAPHRSRVGVFIARSESDPDGQKYLSALKETLQSQGDGAVELITRWAVRDVDHARANVREVASLGLDALVVLSSTYLRAARETAGDRPIVFVATADPVGQGFVASLARPGGNTTGFAAEESDMAAKWVELLKEMAPRTSRCVVLFNPETAPNIQGFMSVLEASGSALRMAIDKASTRSEKDVKQAIALAAEGGTGGLVVVPDPWSVSRRKLIVELAARHTVPAVFYDRTFVQVGGLVSYGIDRIDLFRRAARYLHLILRGQSPADLPVQQPVRFELVLNMRAARQLGLTVPPSVFSRADEVIE